MHLHVYATKIVILIANTSRWRFSFEKNRSWMKLCSVPLKPEMFDGVRVRSWMLICSAVRFFPCDCPVLVDLFYVQMVHLIFFGRYIFSDLISKRRLTEPSYVKSELTTENRLYMHFSCIRTHADIWQIILLGQIQKYTGCQSALRSSLVSTEICSNKRSYISKTDEMSYVDWIKYNSKNLTAANSHKQKNA